jgi:hypothetical protein
MDNYLLGAPFKPAVGLSGAVSYTKSNYPTQAKEACVGHPSVALNAV